jgi:hypothetical protein
MLSKVTLASLTAEAVEAGYWTTVLCGAMGREDIDKALELNRQHRSMSCHFT